MVQSLPPNAPAPRLCTLQKVAPDQEYGYNLHAEKNRGQFVGMVDKGSVADIGGLRTGDRIFAINGHSIVGESHKKVVERIKQDPNKCEMLVATEEEAKWYAEHNIPITLQLQNIVKVPGDHVSHRGSNVNNSPPPATWYAPSGKPADPVFVAPPPPQDDMDHPLPIICVLNKNSPSDEFGFNLHAEKGRGHFIGTVDADGIGDNAGLRLGQRIVGVNGTLVYPNTPHKEVVSLIKRSPMSTTLLLASEDVDQWYKQHNEEFSFDKARKALEPVQQLSPHSIQISDEEILEETPSPAPRHEARKVEEAPPLPTAVHYVQPPMAQYDLVPDSEVDIMAAVFGQVSVPEIVADVAVHELVSHEQAHLVEHHGHEEPALKADPHQFEEHHDDVPAYNAYASPPVSVVHHLEEEHHVHHHDDHYHADYNHNGHSHDHYHNGKSNGYSSNASDSSDLGIFHLSAKEARERLRQQKKRAQDMSLEEKYRFVSNM